MSNQVSDVVQASYLCCRKADPHLLVSWAVHSALPWYRFDLTDRNDVERRIPVAHRIVWTPPTCYTPDTSWKTLAGVLFRL